MSTRHYHGTRRALSPGDLVAPEATPAGHVLLTTNVDEAIWSAELGEGEGPPRVYLVEPLGAIAAVAELPGHVAPGHPAMSSWSRAPLRVTREVDDWLHYHGTRADLRPGDLVEPGRVSNFGATRKRANHVYFARTLDAATWGAELAVGEGPGRIYVVEPTGPFEDDPNLTDKKFRGNPTKSLRSRAPLRVVGEITEWQGHPPQAVQAMKDALARLAGQGIEADDD